jgi:hybrid cluster-associated redox disulfide protein
MPNINPSFSPQSTVAELLESYPQAIPIFLKHGMSCVGCSMSAFETLEDAARIYRVDFSLFQQELAEILTFNQD